MTATTVPPGFRPRGVFITGELPIRPRSRPRPAPVQRNPSAPPRTPPAVQFGAPLWVYLIGLVLSTAGIVVLSFGLGRGVDLWTGSAFAASTWGISLTGVIDYARRGAR